MHQSLYLTLLIAACGACTKATGGAAATAGSGGATSSGNATSGSMSSSGETTSASSGTTSSTGSGGPGAGTIRVYVAGESIERRNRYVEAPFKGDGSLNDRGGGELRNDTDEYGWMVPLADRLAKRTNGGTTIAWVGTGEWSDADDQPYSGKYPSTTAAKTSAIGGTSIDSWMEQRKAELQNKTHCYDVAFASRGGNDYGLDSDTDIQQSLEALIVLLDGGSNCKKHPIVYVTGHMPDLQDNEPQNTQTVQKQTHRFVTRMKAVVTKLASSKPEIRARFIDMYTPFVNNQKTTAFPNEVWSNGGVPDYAKIGRVGDLMHPRRLASIYAGEIVADAIDLKELTNIL